MLHESLEILAAAWSGDGPGIAMIRGNEAVARVLLTNHREAADAFQSSSGSAVICLVQTVDEALLCAAAIAAHRGAQHDAQTRESN